MGPFLYREKKEVKIPSGKLYLYFKPLVTYIVNDNEFFSMYINDNINMYIAHNYNIKYN